MKKYYFLFFVFTVLVLFSFQKIPAMAASENGVVVNKNGSEVSFIIPKIRNNYKVYKNDSLIYDGANNTFTDNLSDDKQKYSIGVYKGNKLEKVYSLKVASNTNKEVNKKLLSVKNSSEKIDYDTAIKEAVYNSSLQTIVDSNSVKLQWPKLPDVDGIYEVYTNGKPSF